MRQQTSAAARLGISSFVYEARRPFDPQRLFRVLEEWPIPLKKADEYLRSLVTQTEQAQAGEEAGGATAGASRRGTVEGNGGMSDAQSGVEDAAKPKASGEALKNVVRSKGFCWVADSPTSSLYWSHTGRHFELGDAGRWWADTPPHLLQRAQDADPAGLAHVLEDWSGEWGDRRQEIVFIGAGMDEEGIRMALDSCLLSDREMSVFAENLERVAAAMGERRFDVGDRVVCRCVGGRECQSVCMRVRACACVYRGSMNLYASVSLSVVLVLSPPTSLERGVHVGQLSGENVAICTEMFHSYMHAYIHTCIHACIQTQHTRTHTHTHTYTHTHIIFQVRRVERGYCGGAGLSRTWLAY
jgi:hypothetical protein